MLVVPHRHLPCLARRVRLALSVASAILVCGRDSSGFDSEHPCNLRLRGAACAGGPEPHLRNETQEERGFAHAYSEYMGVQAAYLATAAYCGAPLRSDEPLQNWSCGDACSLSPRLQQVRSVHGRRGSVGHAYVGLLGDTQCVVAFRGTANLAGWMSDIQSAVSVDLNASGIPCSAGGKPCRAASGFLDAYLSIADYIRGNLTAIGCHPDDEDGDDLAGTPAERGPVRSLLLTGHSLGGAEVMFAMHDLMGRGYKNMTGITFGQPRTGNDVFVEAFEHRLIEHGSSFFRVTHSRDPVVHLPMRVLGFQHGGTEVFYAGDVAAGHQMCKGAEDPHCAASHSDMFLPILIAGCMEPTREGRETKCPHLGYLFDAKETPMDGTSCGTLTSARFATTPTASLYGVPVVV